VPIRLWTLSIVLSFLTGEYFSSWFWFGQEVEDWGWAFSKWFISLEPQSNGGWCSYPLCSACAWMVGSTVPRSVDGKKRIIGIASKVTRLVTLGLLFLGPSKILNILGKNMWPGPQAVLDQCNLHGSDKWHVEGNAAALGDLMMSVHQTKCQAYITYFLFQTFAVFWMLYVFFWVIPRCLNFICQRFGTLCLFHLHTTYKNGTDTVFRNVCSIFMDVVSLYYLWRRNTECRNVCSISIGCVILYYLWRWKRHKAAETSVPYVWVVWAYITHEDETDVSANCVSSILIGGVSLHRPWR